MEYRSRLESDSGFQLKLPWNTNSFVSWVISVCIVGGFLLVVGTSNYERVTPKDDFRDQIQIDIINFGDGDGTGVSKGNLAEEGIAYLSKEQARDLYDAEKRAKTRVAKEIQDNSDLTANPVPAEELGSDKNADRGGTSARDLGTKKGEETGTGLGDRGFGPGAGQGYGDIEWGGGGNRVVLNKVVPKFPDGVNASAQIKIRFRVAQDGTVTQMIPYQKADPAFEKAAMDALRLWRFNPLKENKDMYGVITFTFRLS